MEKIAELKAEIERLQADNELNAKWRETWHNRCHAAEAERDEAQDANWQHLDDRITVTVELDDARAALAKVTAERDEARVRVDLRDGAINELRQSRDKARSSMAVVTDERDEARAALAKCEDENERLREALVRIVHYGGGGVRLVIDTARRALDGAGEE